MVRGSFASILPSVRSRLSSEAITPVWREGPGESLSFLGVAVQADVVPDVQLLDRDVVRAPSAPRARGRSFGIRGTGANRPCSGFGQFGVGVLIPTGS